jgi:hypothetical protein
MRANACFVLLSKPSYTREDRPYCPCSDYNKLPVSKTTNALPLICPCGSDDRASVNQKNVQILTLIGSFK